jgi:hypothetical protein
VVNDPVRVELTVALEVTAEHIEGTVRSGDRPALPFHGWSELFAVLLTVASGTGQDRMPPDQHQQTTQELDTAP